MNDNNSFVDNENFGLGIVADTDQNLQLFQQICSTYFLPISKENCHVTSQYNHDIMGKYLTTAINYLRSEYAIIVILKNVQCNESLSYEKTFTLNNKLYRYELKVLSQHDDETYEKLIQRIRASLLGEAFASDANYHQSIPSLPAPKQPQFVSLSTYSQIACWSLPRQRDLKRFRQELGVTHMITLLNENEISQSNICSYIKSAGIESFHIPIQGGDLSVLTEPKTISLLREQLLIIRDLILNSTEMAPVKMIIHCAAGLHRTGSITYLLLRLCHFTADQALLIINRTRAITARQVGQKRIDTIEHYLLKELQ